MSKITAVKLCKTVEFMGKEYSVNWEVKGDMAGYITSIQTDLRFESEEEADDYLDENWDERSIYVLGSFYNLTLCADGELIIRKNL